MRNIFIKKSIDFAREHEDLYFLTADLGFKALEAFRDQFPDRFINVGAAESNMIGLAAGMAMMGKKVCVYSIVPFVTLRCLEQIRNDVCWHGFNVILVGVGGGFSYGNQGVSHNTTEDIAVMRTLPNMSVFSPGDAREAEAMVDIAFHHTGPAYLRLGRVGRDAPYQFTPTFEYGKGVLVKDGTDITIISTGNILDVAAEVVEALENRNQSVRMISMPCVKPLDKKLIVKAAKETKAVFVIEEHSVIGGLGSAVAETIMESEHSGIVFKRFGVEDCFPDRIGSQQYLRERSGISSQSIVLSISSLLSL